MKQIILIFASVLLIVGCGNNSTNSQPETKTELSLEELQIKYNTLTSDSSQVCQRTSKEVGKVKSLTLSVNTLIVGNDSLQFLYASGENESWSPDSQFPLYTEAKLFGNEVRPLINAITEINSKSMGKPETEDATYSYGGKGDNGKLNYVAYYDSDSQSWKYIVGVGTMKGYGAVTLTREEAEKFVEILVKSEKMFEQSVFNKH